jgi:hypothetical protein
LEQYAHRHYWLAPVVTMQLAQTMIAARGDWPGNPDNRCLGAASLLTVISGFAATGSQEIWPVWAMRNAHQAG